MSLTPPPENDPAAGPRWTWLSGALLVLLPLAAYARLAWAGFVWDDDTTLTANALIRAGDGLRRIWFTTQPTDYWPVTYSCLWAEWRLWGLWAPGYHLANLLLHAACAVVLWRLLLRLGLPGAWVAALWFALHPLNVETVAWITQQKSLLAMLFFLASLRLFAESRVPDSGRVDRWCLLAWAAFVLSMLSKGSTAPLPFVLLGWVLWRRRLRWTDVPWLGGYFLTATALAAVNVWFSHKSGGEVIRAVGWAGRLAGAGGAFWFYLGKIAWPLRLCFVYPHWTVPPVNPFWWLGLGLAVAGTIALGLARRRGARPELYAWLYVGIMLLPVLGLTDVYFMRYSLVADHYAHLALAGALAWAAARFSRLPRSPILACAVALGLGGLTFAQTAIYRDNFTLFRSVLAQNPECWMAHNNLGKALLDSRSPALIPEAVGHFGESLRLNPAQAEAHIALGTALERQGRPEQAVAQYQEAIRLKPRFAEAHNDLGSVWSTLPGRLPDAIAEFQEAIRLKPGLAEPHANLGNAWAAVPGRRDDAIAQYREAIRLKPEYADAHANLGNALGEVPGGLDEAIAELRTALRLDPDNAGAHYDLASALLQVPGRSQEAAEHLKAVLRLEPDNEAARKVLSLIPEAQP